MSNESTAAPQDLSEIQKLISSGELSVALKQLKELPSELRGTSDALYMSAVCGA